MCYAIPLDFSQNFPLYFYPCVRLFETVGCTPSQNRFESDHFASMWPFFVQNRTHFSVNACAHLLEMKLKLILMKHKKPNENYMRKSLPVLVPPLTIKAQWRPIYYYLRRIYYMEYCFYLRDNGVFARKNVHGRETMESNHVILLAHSIPWKS